MSVMRQRRTGLKTPSTSDEVRLKADTTADEVRLKADATEIVRLAWALRQCDLQVSVIRPKSSRGS